MLNRRNKAWQDNSWYTAELQLSQSHLAFEAWLLLLGTVLSLCGTLLAECSKAAEAVQVWLGSLLPRFRLPCLPGPLHSESSTLQNNDYSTQTKRPLSCLSSADIRATRCGQA